MAMNAQQRRDWWHQKYPDYPHIVVTAGTAWPRPERVGDVDFVRCPFPEWKRAFWGFRTQSAAEEFSRLHRGSLSR